MPGVSAPGGEPPAQPVAVQVGDRTLRLSHLAKRLWPDGWTKAEMIEYYATVADAMVPHLAGRPASFVRLPTGTGGERFYAKAPPQGLPDWVPRVAVPSHRAGEKPHAAVDGRPALVALAQLYCVELHVPQWREETGADRHDRLVVDLDPGPGRDVTDCCAVALLMRERLAADGLPCWAKTSGAKGMHLYARLRDEPAERAVGYARAVAEELAAAHPDLLTAKMAKALRPGRVFLDWSQNSSAKTTAAPYSLRATEPHPGVSTPLTWDEVENCRRPADLAFSPAEVLERVAEHGDLLAPLLTARSRRLPGP